MLRVYDQRHRSAETVSGAGRRDDQKELGQADDSMVVDAFVKAFGEQACAAGV
jgi:hypothetical protein